MDIAAWLRSLGLERYEPVFRDNEIDAAVLPELTDAHLKELGLPLGPRLKLLKAVAALRTEPPVADGPLPATAAQTAEGEGRRAPTLTIPEAERRQLTVLFADLVGSTALSYRLDPEDMREVIRAYQTTAAGEVLRFGGHVAQYVGDGVLAYFGWPRAQEDAAERAVRAGLAVVEAVRQLSAPTDVPLTARVGIATGLVVVGDPEGAGREGAVVGEAPNLAARLQTLAEPGSVVIGEETRRLIGRLFELRALGGEALKGVPQPVPVFAVLGTSGTAEGRFEALHGAGLMPLVGREQEIALLLDRWQQAKEGEGQVVLLSGEPGIGKSRLAWALRERLADEPHIPLSYFCSPFHQTSALHPVIDLLGRAAGFTRDDSPEQMFAKLEALLARGTEDVAAAAPSVAALLSLPTQGRYPPLAFSPQRLKGGVFDTLLGQLAGLAAEKPVLALFEDVQWADPTTLELTELVIERAQSLPVLIVITFRPEFALPWHGWAHATTLTLNRLSRTRSAAIVAGLTGGKTLPARILGQILAKTEGVPLFLEELTKAVLESGLLREVGDRYELAGELPPLAIPATLQDSLLARLDRRAPVKEVAQIGAAIGREFSYELLAAVAPLSGDGLQDALAQLAKAELVFRRDAPPRASYVFKHALVRDVAYQSLLRSKRQRLHARIARVLEERFPETDEAQPEVLAHHCTEAGLVDKAVKYWHRAGQRALARSATAEAVAQLTRGLDLLKALPDGMERRRQELDPQLTLGSVLIAAKGQAASETSHAYARARQLCAEAGATAELIPALYGQYVVHFQRGELAAAYEVARELLHLAQERGDAAAQVTGQRIIGSASFQLGRLLESRTHLEEGLVLYDPVRDRSSALTYAIDSRVVCSHWLSHALLALGYPKQALARNGEMLTYARELAYPNTLAQALPSACSLYVLLRRRRDALAQAEALIALAREQDFPLWLAGGTIIRGWALADGGRTEDDIAAIHQGLADYWATGAELWSPYFLALLADAYGRTGQPAAGLGLLTDALDRVERTGGRWLETDLHRLRGELLLVLPDRDPAEAEACFRRAIAVAREQSAKTWELRAAISLGRLWRDQGKQAETHDLLASLYGWFGEGFDTPDLRGARELLEALR